MGSSSSRAASHGAATLSEKQAWAFTLTWRDQLRGCVRLETEPEWLLASVIPSFEWVAFVFNGKTNDGFQELSDPATTAAYARAATAVWFALSCCHGYSGSENPQFWKRVFLELLYPKELRPDLQTEPNPKRAQLYMTDAVGMFNDPKKPFPRVKLVVGDAAENATIERVFFGRLAYPDKKRDRQLRRILTKLKPYIRGAHWEREIPVVVDELRVANIATLLREVAQPASLEKLEPRQGSPLDSLEMQLHSVILSDYIYFGLLDDLHTQLPAWDVEMIVPAGLWNLVLQRRMWRCLLPQDPAGVQPRIRVDWLSIAQTTELSYSFVGVLCSALPHIPSIASVSLQSARYIAYGAPSSPASDWAWLGYAIFHPDAASQSRFTSISVPLERFSLSDGAALRRMAHGNNLLRDSDTTTPSSSYIEGRVQASTQSWTEPQLATEPLHKFEADTWVSLCVSSVDALEARDWVCVVIPGRGLGWIRSSDVLETRSRQPGRSCIHVLRVCAYYRSVDEENLTSLLAVLGDSLTTLDLQNSQRVPATVVHTIMRLCPNLKSLRIHHDGSFWANEELAMSSPRLEELELRIGDCSGVETMKLVPLQAICLPRLKTLRLLTYCEDSFESDEDIAISFLRQHHGLEYFHWSRGYDLTPSWVSESYDRVHEDSQKFRNKLEREGLDFFQGPLVLECRLAFLSIFRHRDRETSVRHLAQDITALIFAYAMSFRRRTTFIEPKLPSPPNRW